MQNYLATLLVSPTRQVHLRRIETTTAATAAKVLKLLDTNKITWAQAAKQYSLDPNTKGTGGDMGWVAPGTGDAGIALWAYAPGRKVNDITTTAHQRCVGNLRYSPGPGHRLQPGRRCHHAAECQDRRADILVERATSQSGQSLHHA